MDDSPKFFAAIIKAAKVRSKVVQKFGLLEIQHFIDRGQPVVYTPASTELRDEFLQDFAKRFAADPKLELPSPKDPAEKQKWPKPSEADYYVSNALIVGYKKKRGELILRFPGRAPEVQTFRVREEEAEASLEDIYFIWPD